jgi:hypothetical protein
MYVIKSADPKGRFVQNFLVANGNQQRIANWTTDLQQARIFPTVRAATAAIAAAAMRTGHQTRSGYDIARLATTPTTREFLRQGDTLPQGAQFVGFILRSVDAGQDRDLYFAASNWFDADKNNAAVFATVNDAINSYVKSGRRANVEVLVVADVPGATTVEVLA